MLAKKNDLIFTEFSSKFKTFQLSFYTLYEGHDQLLKFLNKNSKDKFTFIDESVYLDLTTNTWLIDFGASVHVTTIYYRESLRSRLF